MYLTVPPNDDDSFNQYTKIILEFLGLVEWMVLDEITEELNPSILQKIRNKS